MESSATRVIVGFDCLVFISALFGTLVLATVIASPNVMRRSPWYGFVVPMLLYDIILMLGFGTQTDTGPPPALCWFQALILYSIPGWATVAFACFAIDFYFELRNMVNTEKREHDPDRYVYVVSTRKKVVLLVTPLVSFLIFILINELFMATSSHQPPMAMNKDKLYCSPKIRNGLYIGGSIMIMVMIVWILVMVNCGILLKTHYSRLRSNHPISAINRMLSLFIRMSAISISCGLVIGMYLVSFATKNADDLVTSFLLSLPSLIIFLAFGTQRDIMSCWAFWRKKLNWAYERRTTIDLTDGKVTPNDLKKVGYNWTMVGMGQAFGIRPRS